MNRRFLRFVFLLLLVGPAASARFARGATGKPNAFDVRETTIAETQTAIRSGRVTCRELVEAYIKRVKAYDQTTHLNSMILLNPEALADADRLDAEFKRTHALRPLHGIVVIVKDNYDTKGLQTTGGSLAMRGVVPTTDAFMVKRLREAGAIVLGKSNMAEWAFSPYVTESSIAGITRNPYALDRVPAGSSGGTAAAVAASLGEVGIGDGYGEFDSRAFVAQCAGGDSADDWADEPRWDCSAELFCRCGWADGAVGGGRGYGAGCGGGV